jgi:N-acetylglucosaminyldiphosphoundecaprenol N-acetyl-beta-D-mannosaminyltransferase
MNTDCPSFRLYLNGPRSFANFTGVRVEAITLQEVLRRIVAWTREKTAPARHIGCINAHNCALAISDARLRAFYNSCDIAGPDGMPFVHWMRLFYRQRTDRIYAPDVLRYLLRSSPQHNLRFYFYGAAEDVLEHMIDSIRRNYPKAGIAGYFAPPFQPLDKSEDRRIWSEIARLEPDVICIGLGAPKQDFFIRDHLHCVRGAVFIGCGATFDFFGGRVQQAPKIIQRMGFEWLFRLLGPDFRRLWRRYTYQHLIFLGNFIRQLLGTGRYELPVDEDTCHRVEHVI